MKNFLHKTSCPKCGSKDNLAVYDNGYKSCFGASCDYYTYGDNDQVDATSDEPQQYKRIPMSGSTLQIKIQTLKSRGLSENTCSFYQYGLTSFHGEAAHIMEYFDLLTGTKRLKLRTADLKGQWSGPKITPQLFGQDKIKEGGKWLIITEGEIDAMSAYQMFGGKYAAVSIPNGVQSAVHDIKNNFKFVNSFEKVVISFDNEPAAQEKAREAAKLLGFGKAYIATLPLKDANDMLMANRAEEFKRAIWEAKEHKPELTISVSDLDNESWDFMFSEGMDICFPKFNRKIGGLRGGATYVLAAQEKIGKSTVLKTITKELLKDGKRVSFIGTEESPMEIAASISCMQKDILFHEFVVLPEAARPNKDEFITDVVKNNLVLYDPKSLSLKDIVENIEYQVLAKNVDVVIFDNISICDEANEMEIKSINKAFINIAATATKYKIPIIVVVHLKKNRTDGEGNDARVVNAADVFGTGAYAKFAHVLFAIEKAEQENTIVLKVIRNRTTGYEGYCDTLKYNPETGNLFIKDDVNSSTQEF